MSVEYEYKSKNEEEISDYLSKIRWCNSILITQDIFVKGQPEDKVFFKIYKSIDNFKSKDGVIGICRLSIFAPEYITGYDENITLSNEEIDEVIETFKIDNGRLWEYLIDESNCALNAMNLKPICEGEKYPLIPDYSILKQ